ncbi:hypothetical protein QR680_002505 [Steinernema hermaphroditum]|uniref:G-protein coupled receptors family 1 profile domain-containing protein n=1 Tax=Steinernema hermaphroditum TaxID=289476 RepID=A0AA39LI87_9BILA|nr:hypothetical protein QR680_002505 [Steinernema hermaphroditum]
MDAGSNISELGIAGTSALVWDNATVTENDTQSFDPCHYDQPPLTAVRFWLVTVFGSTISIISVAENLFLFFLFSTRKHHRTTYNMYMMLLAFFDVFVSMAYVFLMSMNVLSDHLKSVSLIRIWFWYMTPMLTISHIAMTSSSLIIMAATYERFCITTNSRFLPVVQRNRKRIAAAMILLGVFSKGTIYFEFKIGPNEGCEGLMTEIELSFADWVFDTPYHTIFRFWYRNFATIFVPFFILAYLNIRIVRVFTIHQKKSYCADMNDSVEKTKRKITARAATRTLVFVVCTYLISNIINVLITVWEHIDKKSLMSEAYVGMYAIALDLVSLLTNLACATRLPIYLTCQATLRAEVFVIFKRLRGEMKTTDKAGESEGDKESLICENSSVNKPAMPKNWNVQDGKGHYISDVKFATMDAKTPSVLLTVHQNENGETNNNMTPRIFYEESTETLL